MPGEPLAAVTVLRTQPWPMVMVMEALTSDGRRFHMGKGIGQLTVRDAPGDVIMRNIVATGICQLVIERLAALNPEDAEKRLIFLELRTVAGIEARLREGLSAVKAGDLLMLLCHDSQVIDACVPFFDMRASLETAN